MAPRAASNRYRFAAHGDPTAGRYVHVEPARAAEILALENRDGGGRGGSEGSGPSRGQGSGGSTSWRSAASSSGTDGWPLVGEPLPSPAVTATGPLRVLKTISPLSPRATAVATVAWPQNGTSASG